MTHVHYKFSSKLSYDTVVFDGPHITLRDLKRQIMGREKLRAADCDLQITNAQNKEEYTEDEGLIPKGSSVIVRRIPIIGVKSSTSKTRNIERSDGQLQHTFGAFKAMDDQNSSKALPFFFKMTNMAEADVSEEDKIKVLNNQSQLDPGSYKKFGTVLPSNYTCYRCGNTGHHIRSCPTSGQDKNFEAPVRIKKSSGIPRSFMVEVDDPNTKGAMLTNCGRYAVPTIDAQAYAIGKKERPPFLPQEQPRSEDEEDPVPEELLCLICHDLLSDAVVIPCCGNSYCDDCIRSALLDSEEHVCPTCSQSDVSPDTLIANKFLRQAVDNFKKERGHTKSLKRGSGTSQSQNPTPTPSPVPTPPPLAVQSQPLRSYPSTSSQQDPLLPAADTPPSSQVCAALPTATGLASAPNTPSTSLQPVQSPLEIPDREDEEKTPDDSAAAAAPSVAVSPKDPADAPSQLIPLVAAVVEPPQTVGVTPQHTSSAPATRPSGPPPSWDSPSSSSGCPTGGWSESNTQQPPPPPPPPPSSASSSYPATPPPPLFPSPHFHPFLTAQPPLTSYPPGYPPPAPLWTIPNLQGAPIPSLCPSTSIPTLIPKEWYRHQRKKKERSPHRGSSHRRSSSSRSNSKSSKSKTSRSYSRSSSRSRSRSRSQSKSRPHSPYSRPRNQHTRYQSSHSYSYGYKRSPTPSSSSSPRVGYRSRSKSPSDHRRNSHHSRHHSKKSSLSGRRRGDHPHRDADRSLTSHMYAQHAQQPTGMDLDRERYLQWEREYKGWCDKYFSSYFGHFQQLPLPLLNLPPTPQWGDSRNPSHANPDSRRRAARTDGRSPPSRSSSDSHSSPSHSSCDSRSTPSQSSSDSRSSPSHSSNDSRSPPSQSSSDRRSTPSKDGAQQRPVTPTKGTKEMEEGSKDDKRLIAKNLETLSTLKHKQKSVKKHKEVRGEESSSPDAADSTDDCRKDKTRNSTGPSACKDGSQAQEEATASDALESVQALVKPDKRLAKDYDRKSTEQRNSEMEKGWRRSKQSDSRHRGKPSKEADGYRYHRGRAADSRSEKTRKRKGEDMVRSSVEAQSLKTKTAEIPNAQKSKSPSPFARKKPKPENKKERKMCPLTERDIWEGGIKVKPQKKISININLEAKGKEERTETRDSSYFESIAGTTKAEIEKAGNGEDEKLNRGETEENEKNESSRDVEEENTKPAEGEARQKWEKATFRDDKGEMSEDIAGEKEEGGEEKDDGQQVDFNLWHSVLRGVEEDGEGMGASRGEEVSVRGGEEEQTMPELVADTWKERAGGGSTCKENRGNLPKEELTEGVNWRMRRGGEEDDDVIKSERSGNESHHDGSNTTMVDDGSSYEDRQERKTLVKTLEYTQDRAADGQEELALIQVPRSKWEKEESEEEERDEGAVKVQTDAFALPSPSVSVTAEAPPTFQRETETEEKRERSVAMGRGRDREREKTPVVSRSDRSVAPSSGKERYHSGLSTDREKRMEVERRRDRERGRERPRDRQKERKRSKERAREEEKGRDRQHGGVASAQKRNSSSHSFSRSHDTERRDRQQGHSGRSKESRATELPDQHKHKSLRDTLLDSQFKDHLHYYLNHQDLSGSYRPAGTHHFSPLPNSQGKELEPRMSSPRRRQVIKEGKESVSASQWEDEADEVDGQRELEEGERPSSCSNSVSSSSASQENGGRDEQRKKKPKKHKREKRQAAPELLEEEEGEPRRHKMKKSRDGREEEEKMDDAQLCSFMPS